MTASSGRRCVTALVVAGLFVGILLPLVSCGGATPGEVTVPVLWATTAGAEPRGGVEPATVEVTDGDGGFTVDLGDVEAEGAGPAWLAASSAAATVATLVSASDPSVLDIRFGVTGPIDGPSGGAALTVAVLAAIRGLSLQPGVTMTGTVSPDGAVGIVGAVPVKVRAAADAGYKVVLVPVANINDRDSQTGQDLVTFGASLGVEVRAVNDIGEALGAFTGTPITAGSETPVPLGVGSVVASEAQAQAMVGRLDQALTSFTGDAAVVAVASERATVARDSLVGGDPAFAYGAATEGWLRLVRSQAVSTASGVVGTGDTTGLRVSLDAEAGRLAAEARRLLAAAAAEEWSAVQTFNLPAAMGWLTYATAALDGARRTLPQATPADLTTTAAVIAEQQASIDVLWPDAVASVRALETGSARWPDNDEGFLSRYTGLLVSAGEANDAYLDAVLQSGGAGSSVGDPARVAAQAAKAIVAEDLGTTASLSAALTYWFISATSVSTRQSFGINNSGPDGEPGIPSSPEKLARAVDNAASTVAVLANRLAGQGVDTSYLSWSAAWGNAASQVDIGTLTASGELLALGELWYSSVSGFCQSAALSAAAGSG